jgi:hypothetical protein
MKELLLALLEAANKLYPMRGVHTGWCTVGMFSYEGKIYSFIIEGNKGTFRRVDIGTKENEWFDVIKTGNRLTSIIHFGIKYDAQPILQL